MSKKFVHLHLHTDYSLLDGAIKIGPLAKRASGLGMEAVAITDHGNLYGALSFYHKMKAEGVKPIIGIEAYIARGSRHEKGQGNLSPGEKATNHIVLLAKNLAGYHNLIKLSSFSFVEGFWRKPRIDRELLSQHSEGIIGLSACLSGVPPVLLLQNKFDEAAKAACEFEEILGKGNYYLELQEHGLDAQNRIRKPLVEISQKTGIPLVVTNDSHYLLESDVKAHDTLLCIGTGKTLSDPNRLTYGSPKYYFRSAEEMWQVFAEVPHALYKTVEIAEKCDLIFPKTIDQVPAFPVPEGFSTDTYFEKVVRDGFEERLKEVWSPLQQTGSLRHSMLEYQERLSHEIKTIKKMGFPGYFLIVWDFIRYAKRKDIPVGPGRGSAAGSLVAYCLKITDVDPLQYDLLFERFLNPERVTMPDIDVDFCVRGRAEVIDYVSDLYGRQNVAQIITFGTMASRAVIKDVGRALEMPYAEVEKVAKMIPPPIRGRNVSIEEAIRQNADLKKLVDNNSQVAELIEIGRKLEGCARHTSVHAAGVVISPYPIYELVPVCKGQNGELITQFVMSDLEKTGMLKMDFLALTTLTIVADCLKSIEAETGKKIDLSQVPLNDASALKLFSDGTLNAVFQFESSGMVEICRKFRPEGLEDLSALNALYRPGPLDGGMVDDYIERRHGRRRVTYITSQMKSILENTYGVIVYQEQIMQLAQTLAGYSLGEADLMRRAMGKKKKEEMAIHKEKFIEGAIRRGVAAEKADKVFNLMAQFADYGFNRSHSFAYAYLAYHTAFLKAHYPAHFYAAVLSNEISNTSKIARYISEMNHLDVKLMPPDVNFSQEGFTSLRGAIRFGLAGIKGIGGAAVQAIIRARKEFGRFRSMFNFVEKVDARVVNKRVIECLIKAGAFNSVDINQAALFESLDEVIDQALHSQKTRLSGQTGLFELASSELVLQKDVERQSTSPPWPRKDCLAYEKEVLGFYASGHPLEEYTEAIKSLTKINNSNITKCVHGEEAALGGIIVDLSIKLTKKGDRFALFRLEDQYGSSKIVCWPEQFSRFKTIIQSEEAVLVVGRVELSDEGEATIITQDVQQLERAKSKTAKLVSIKASASHINAESLSVLKSTLCQYPGSSLLYFDVQDENGATARFRPQQFYKVNPTAEFATAVQSVPGNWKVEIVS